LAGVISLSAGTLSRVDIQFNPIATANKGRPLHLELQVTNFSGTPIRQVRVFFRGIGDARFKYRRMRDRGMQYLADLNLRRVDGNLVEYFFDVEYIDGAHQSYPEEAPNANLLKTAIDQTVEADNGIVIISPEPDEEILTDEMLITVSFPRFSGQVDPERVRLSIDRWDVSRYVKVYDDFLNFAPRQVPPESIPSIWNCTINRENFWPARNGNLPLSPAKARRRCLLKCSILTAIFMAKFVTKACWTAPRIRPTAGRDLISTPVINIFPSAGRRFCPTRKTKTFNR